MWLRSMNHHPITNVFRYLKQRFYPFLCILGWRLIPLPLSKAWIHTAYFELGWKTPGFVKAAYPKSSVQSQEEGHHTKLLGLESQPRRWWKLMIATMLIDDKKGGSFFGGAKRWYRLMLHHNLWHLWFIYITSVVLFSSVTYDVACSKTLYMRRLIWSPQSCHRLFKVEQDLISCPNEFKDLGMTTIYIYIYVYYNIYVHITHYIYTSKSAFGA